MRRVDPNSLQFSEQLVPIKARRDFVGGRVDHEKPRGMVGVRRNAFLGIDSSENVFARVAELSNMWADNTLPALGGRFHETYLGATREENCVPVR